MILKKQILLALSFFLVANIAVAQRASKAKTKTLSPDEAKAVNKDAGGMFDDEDYSDALNAYQQLIKTKPQSFEYNLRLGICYLLSNSIKAKGIQYLEFASKMKEAKKDVQYYLGMAYMNANRWDDAVKAFNDYKAGGSPKLVNKDFLPVERMLEMCANGKELTAHPIDIKFDDMGKNVNSPYEDYNPYISADGKTLVYTSRRKGNMGGMILGKGLYTADVYWTFWKDTVWAKAKSVGVGINTDWDEETTGLTPDGQCMFLYFDNMEVFGDIAMSSLFFLFWLFVFLMSDKIFFFFVFVFGVCLCCVWWFGRIGFMDCQTPGRR